MGKDHSTPITLASWLKHWVAVISLIVLGGNMNACALGGSASWKEEVLLHDGKIILVARSITRHGRHELGQRPPIGEQSLTFTMPDTGQVIRWTDKYGEDVGSANFSPIMLEIVNDRVYLVGVPMGCLSYNKWGRPNPPYVIFKYQDRDWQRIALNELPVELKSPNLIISSPDDGAKRAVKGVVLAGVVRELNAGAKLPQYQSIIREPLKAGSIGVSCPDYSSPRYMSPKAPFPISGADSGGNNR